MIYKIKKFQSCGVEMVNIIKENEDGSYIAMLENSDNTDYQAFLKYQAEGGVVLPADEVTE
jgi:hypothetical protein